METVWRQLPKGILGLIQELIEGAKEVLINPQADPQKTVLLLGILFIFLLAVTMLGVLAYSVFLTPAGKKAPPRRPAGLTSTEQWIGRGILAIMILITLASASLYPSQISVCISCHVEEKPYKSWYKSSHSEVHCLACHQEPGVSGFVIHRITYLRWALLFATNKYREPLSASVSNPSCIRCHKEVMNKVISRYGVRVRHRDFLEKGDRCTDCHNTVAHGDEVPLPHYPSMDKCITCHDNKVASAECELCHTADIGKEIRRTRRQLVKINTPPMRNCRGCHYGQTAQTCLQCHGLELPHPPNWRQKDHARIAFTNKTICTEKCHAFPAGLEPLEPHLDVSGPPYNQIFCNKCHAFPSLHGPEERWIKLHGPVALKKVKRVEPICLACHDEDASATNLAKCSVCHGEEFCDLCHVGKKEAE